MLVPHVRQFHQSDLVLHLDTASLTPGGDALLLGLDGGSVGNGGAVARTWSGIGSLRSSVHDEVLVYRGSRRGHTIL